MQIGCRSKTSPLGQLVSVALLIALLPHAGGCAARHDQGGPLRQAAPADTRPPTHGRVYLFPGVGAGKLQFGFIRDALYSAGVVADVRITEWDTPWYNALGHLQDLERNVAAAAEIAAEITAYHTAHPTEPIDLLGYSGGGGKALLVAAALPPQVKVRNVVLVQAAVSGTYDLSPVLARTYGLLVNFYAPHDWAILGLGTQTFGTIDREYTPSAGKDGFDLAAAVPDTLLRHRVRQHHWEGAWLAHGHFGNHLSLLNPAWNRAFVAPYLLPDGAPLFTVLPGGTAPVSR